MGMMTLVRVLPADQFDHIVSLRNKQDKENSRSTSEITDHTQNVNA